jgi:hypothetical protein
MDHRADFRVFTDSVLKSSLTDFRVFSDSVWSLL